MNLDKRRHVFRADLAELALSGKVEAERFVSPTAARIALPVESVHRSPAADAMQISQVLFGEDVDVFERRNGWAWIRSAVDGYVGYVREAALATTMPLLTHRISAHATQLFPAADLKSVPAIALPLASRLAVCGKSGGYLELATGGFVFEAHTSAINTFAADFVSVAERFLHVPYLWGGKTSAGLDCSGLVQVSLQAAGISAPRDADMQQAELGQAIDQANLRRGDLVFWKGHVGIMQDSHRLLHANGHHMMVVSEPFGEAVARIALSGTPVAATKRL